MGEKSAAKQPYKACSSVQDSSAFIFLEPKKKRKKQSPPINNVQLFPVSSSLQAYLSSSPK
jgi:hypothetical protein